MSYLSSPKGTTNYFIFVVVITGLFMLFTGGTKMFQLLRKIMGAFKGLQFNPNTTLSEKQKKAIAISAVYSSQQNAFQDSLETGMVKEDIQTILYDWWDIRDSESAKNTLQYLVQKGHRFYFPYVLEVFTQKEVSPEDFLVEKFELREDYEKAVSQVYHLSESFDTLKEDEVINDFPDIPKYGVGAWDYGRLVFVSRLCYDFKLISQQEAWEFINLAQEQTIADSCINNWSDFAKSYVIGRALWGGNSSGNSGIKMLADELLTTEKSPWKMSIA